MQKVLLFEEDIFNLQIKVSLTQECALERDLFSSWSVLRVSRLAKWLASDESNFTREEGLIIPKILPTDTSCVPVKQEVLNSSCS